MQTINQFMETLSYRKAKWPDILSRDKKIRSREGNIQVMEVRVVEVFYKTLLGNFHGASEFVREKEIFEL